MDNEVERIAFMNEWLQKTEIEFSRVPGVNFLEYDKSVYDQGRRLGLYGFDLTHSEIGCFLAHRDCWKAIAKKGSHSLILESDVLPAINREYKIREILSDLELCRQSFDMVRLHGIFQRNEIVDRSVCNLRDNAQLVQTLGDPMGAGAYLLSPTAAKRLIQLSERIWCPVDVFLSQTWRHKLRFRTVKPYPFQVADFPSVIGENRRRPQQSMLTRMRIEKNRFANDLRRLAYMPAHFFK